MTAIVFRTPGTIDVRAFTTMGVNAKPGVENPIGYFGTGLKYAVAVLARLGAQLTVHTGGVRYWFEAVPMKFRGQEFQQLTMRRDAWVGGEGWRLGRRQKLPFTTLYGRNWEPWMAFRELYSNTLDEGGEAWEIEGEVDAAAMRQNVTANGHTYIMVAQCEAFTKAYRDRSSIFLDLSERELKATIPGIEIREGSTQRLFYQGMRAKDVGKPTLHTYNFTTGQILTEDRQLAHEWHVRSALANTIAGHCDDEKLIEEIITAKDGLWEHGLEPSPHIAPSLAFHRVMMRRPRGVGGGFGRYYGTHDTRPEAVRKDLWRDALRPWRVDGGDVVSADGTAMFSRPYNMNEQVWAQLADKLVSVANRAPRGAETPEGPATEDLEKGAYCAGYDDGWDDGRDPESVDPRKDSTARSDGMCNYMSSPHFPGTSFPTTREMVAEDIGLDPPEVLAAEAEHELLMTVDDGDIMRDDDVPF